MLRASAMAWITLLLELNKLVLFSWHLTTTLSLFRNKWFILDEMAQLNTSKAIYLQSQENPSIVFHFRTTIFFPKLISWPMLTIREFIRGKFEIKLEWKRNKTLLFSFPKYVKLWSIPLDHFMKINFLFLNSVSIILMR